MFKGGASMNPCHNWFCGVGKVVSFLCTLSNAHPVENLQRRAQNKSNAVLFSLKCSTPEVDPISEPVTHQVQLLRVV